MARNLVRLLLLAAVLTPLPAAAPSLARYGVVEVPPLQTSAYVASVSMAVTPFQRENGIYRAEYAARVFPYFFLNEHGRIEIDVPDQALREIERGATISFQGRALRSDGRERPVTGRASPVDAKTGRIKVRVVISRRVILVFNTTYRLTGTGP